MSNTGLGSTIRRHISTGTKTFAVSDDPPLFVSGDGVWLSDADGRRYLDFACGSGTSNLGHNHPAVLNAARAQLDTGIVHSGPHFHTTSQAKLYDRLAQLLPEALSRFHPSTNGTEATEVALKAAMHFSGAGRFLAFDGGYHGRSFGALAVSSSKGVNQKLAPFAPDCVFLPFGSDAATLNKALSAEGPFAAIIVEPVQATQGMILPREGFLNELAVLARQTETLLIFDEIFTGFGRSGSLFYFEQTAVVPDLLVFAKAFGGGFPGGLVAGREDVMTSWAPGAQSSTFQLHPVAAAAALGALEYTLANDLAAAARQIGGWLNEKCHGLLRHGCVADVRGLGAMYGVEIVDQAGRPDQPRTKAIRALALARGLITWECGAAGHVVGLVPPLTIDEAHASQAVAILDEAIRSTSSG